MNTIIRLFLSIALLLPTMSGIADDFTMSLTGRWSVALDSLNAGISQKWYEKELSGDINLPGTLCDAGLGTPCKLKPEMTKEVFQNLKRRYDYVGAAWYSRTVIVPREWKGRQMMLSLERVQWTSEVWVNGKHVATTGESLSTPHRYDLTNLLIPGQANRLTVRIDNRKQHDMTLNEMAHAYTNETQTKWNGILGDITLAAKSPVFIENIAITPDAANRKLLVGIKLSAPAKGSIAFSVKTPSGNNLATKSIKVAETDSVRFEYQLNEVATWDEFSPLLYRATAVLKAKSKTDTKETTFGIRALTNNDGLLQVNGRRIFLRGTLESCVFPLTGYPPTSTEGWRKAFETARQYGLNHLRFHSWCPPEAAFALADSMGLYLQIELPVWTLNLGKDLPTYRFLEREAKRIIAEYGNHPSFCFLSMGNELEGDFAMIAALRAKLQAADPRRLYTTTTYTFQKGHGDWPEQGDDFFITQRTRQGWVRGQGIFDDKPASFNTDYTASISGIRVPVVSHEIGQYSVYPDLSSINKYTGNLTPLNFMAVKADLQRKGRLNMAADYTSASGKFSALLYKEEIERALRTPRFSGFQLLGLTDYPGQSTALVGILDVFWDSKQLTTPAAFRQFCSPVVPLALFSKAVYTNNETFEATFRTANFSATPLKGVTPKWSLTDSKGTIVASGQLPMQDIQLGNASQIGAITLPLSTISTAKELTLSLRLDGTPYENSWRIWVYPQQLPQENTTVLYTRSFDEAERALKEGRRVLLNPELKDINGIEGRFVPVFWSPVHFPDQPGTMGILCQPEHPALTSFPTREHSDWQWHDICKHAVTMQLDSLTPTVKPVITMIDNFYKNRNLGLLFEANVGKGRLMVCSTDLGQDLDRRPEARQLRHSLLLYMQSDSFSPTLSLSFDRIRQCIEKQQVK